MSAEDTYQRDLAFTSDFVRTPSGDLDTIAGLENLKEAIMRRILTVPGSIIHRPNYGVGLKKFANSLNSLGTQQRLSNLIKDQLLQDDRVESFLGLKVTSPANNPSLVRIVVSVKPVGYAELAVTIEEVS